MIKAVRFIKAIWIKRTDSTRQILMIKGAIAKGSIRKIGILLDWFLSSLQGKMIESS